MARRLAVLGLLLLLPACVLPSSYDARTNGGRYDPSDDDPYYAGQWGVEDKRSGHQNDWTLWLFGPPED